VSQPLTATRGAVPSWSSYFFSKLAPLGFTLGPFCWSMYLLLGD
jgi:hypothetical protein